MAPLRFPTLRGLYDAFPTAAEDVGIAPADTDCIALLRSLTADAAWHPAIALCAYILPRREAVWWGCRSLRAMQQLSPAEVAILGAAEAWVRQPEDAQRRAALALGASSDAGLPATWMALAAGWSGGSIVPPELGYVRAPAEQTARAVRAGMLMAITRLPPAALRDSLGPSIESGIGLVRVGAG